jgi:23S rRNA pseudouridine1911/1915/1917 synthase
MTTPQTKTIPPESQGQRLDKILAEIFPQYSRSQLQTWLKAGHLLVDGKTIDGKKKVAGNEVITLTPQLEEVIEDQPEALPLDIVYEDAAILVINKPAGLTVHPGAGQKSGTLLNALLHHNPGQKNLPRAGIVHRLDKETSGLMVVAKTLEAHHALIKAMQERKIQRHYIALVIGELVSGGSVDAAMGRHPKDRQKMAVLQHVETAKPAKTDYEIIERFPNLTLIRAKLHTGRTHQIRVHMAHIGYPLVGDPVYGKKVPKNKAYADELWQALNQFPRQALHAEYLALHHPIMGELMEWRSELPKDFYELLKKLSLQFEFKIK